VQFSKCLVFEGESFSQTQTFEEDIYKGNNWEKKIFILSKSSSEFSRMCFYRVSEPTTIVKEEIC